MREPSPPQVVSVKNIGLKSFSILFEEIFSFSRAGMYFLLLVKCALEKGVSMEALSETRFFSSDRLFYYLGLLSVEETTRCCNILLRESFKILWSDRWHHHPVLLAIDTTDQPFYGRDNPYVHSTLKMQGLKKKVVKVLRFATIGIVARGFKFTLAVVPVRKKDKLGEVVDRLLRLIPMELKVQAILMDKGFYHPGVFKTVEKHGLQYLIPVKQYKKMTLYYWFSEITGNWRWRYTMRSAGKSKPYTFDIYLEDLGVEFYCGFATNLPMTQRDFEYLLQLYRRRWNIENSYKDAKEYRVGTNSRNHGYRVLLFTISHLLVNLHAVAKRRNKDAVITLHLIKKIFTDMIDPFIPGERPSPDRLSKHIIIAY